MYGLVAASDKTKALSMIESLKRKGYIRVSHWKKDKSLPYLRDGESILLYTSGLEFEEILSRIAEIPEGHEIEVEALDIFFSPAMTDLLLSAGAKPKENMVYAVPSVKREKIRAVSSLRPRRTDSEEREREERTEVTVPPIQVSTSPLSTYSLAFTVIFMVFLFALAFILSNSQKR